MAVPLNGAVFFVYKKNCSDAAEMAAGAETIDNMSLANKKIT